MFDGAVDFLKTLADLARGLEGGQLLAGIAALAFVLLMIVLALGASVDSTKAALIGVLAFFVVIVILASLGATGLAIGMLLVGALLLIILAVAWALRQAKDGSTATRGRASTVNQSSNSYTEPG